MSEARFRIEPLGQQHDRAAFSCGNDSLDTYFIRQVGQDLRRRLTAVFVLYDSVDEKVAGYYTLSAYAVQPADLPDDLTRKLPRYREFPATLIGRLAVSLDFQGHGFGRRLLVDALRRANEQSTQIGAMMVVVDAIDEGAARFYEKYGFSRFILVPDRLYLPIRSVRSLIE